MRWFGLSVVAMATVLISGACGGGSAPEEAFEEPAKVEEAAGEKEQQGSAEAASLDCQLAKVEAELGAAGTEGLLAEWHMQEVEPRLEENLSSALAKAGDLTTFLAEQGYVC